MTGRPLGDRLRLLVITDAEQAAPRPVWDVVAAALAAGAPAVQLRDKRATPRELLETAQALRSATRAAGALLFVNDRLDVAIAAEADGVHLGPDDIPVASARAHAPAGLLIGASTDDPNRARALVREGADYIGCGTVYPTASKPDAGDAIGLERLDAVARAVPVPVLGIGGIDAERSASIAETRAAGVAVIGAVMAAEDPAAAVEALLAPWWKRGG
jgi:thiamine-phosphate pyrophosphorylase